MQNDIRWMSEIFERGARGTRVDQKSLGRFDAMFLRYLRKLFARLQNLIGLL